SVGGAGRICLCACAVASGAAAMAGAGAFGRGCYCGRIAAAVFSAVGGLEAGRWEPAGAANFDAADGGGCGAVLCAFDDRAAHSGLVRAAVSGPLAVSAVFVVQCGLAGGIVDVSLSG